MSDLVYIDTSALIKAYLPEPGSDEFDKFLGSMKSVLISRLTVVEFRCVLARRRRNHEIDADTQLRLMSAFEADIGQSFLQVQPIQDQDAVAAADLLSTLSTVPLRTLDALHLAIARNLCAVGVATGDQVFASAAAALKMRVWSFGLPPNGRRR